MDELKESYIKSLIPKTFKILYIKEKQPETLYEYVDSLRVELIGSQKSFQELRTDVNFQSLINIINYFCDNELEHRKVRREVFKCIDLINKIDNQQRGGTNGGI